MSRHPVQGGDRGQRGGDNEGVGGGRPPHTTLAGRRHSQMNKVRFSAVEKRMFMFLRSKLIIIIQTIPCVILQSTPPLITGLQLSQDNNQEEPIF